MTVTFSRPEDLLREATDIAHRETQLRVRSQTIKALKTAIWKDRVDFVAKGLGRAFKR